MPKRIDPPFDLKSFMAHGDQFHLNMMLIGRQPKLGDAIRRVRRICARDLLQGSGKYRAAPLAVENTQSATSLQRHDRGDERQA